MIRGDVVDPTLTLDNPEIVRRHIRAFLLQNYHQDRLPEINPEERHDLFSRARYGVRVPQRRVSIEPGRF